MAQYKNRDGVVVDWNVNQFDISKVASEPIYNVPDVIDIIALGNDGIFYSVDPENFLNIVCGRSNSKLNEGTLTPGDWRPGSNENDTNPLRTRKLTRSECSNLCKPIVTSGAGAWHKSSEKIPLSGLQYINYESMRIKHPDLNTDTRKGTEFFVLYNRISELSEGAFRGYKLFRPNEFNNRQNWMCYESNGTPSYNSYLIIMYMTKQNLLLQNAFIYGEREPPNVIKTLMNSLTAGSSIASLVGDLCTNPMPETSIMKYGYYYGGDCIYSPNSQYKFVIQPDGNCVVYKYDGSVVWASNTWSKSYIRCKLCVENDGNLIIWSQVDSLSARLTNVSTTKGSYLFLSNTGILLLKDNVTNAIIWSTGTSDWKFTPSTEKRFIYEWGSDYQGGFVRYSPNMVYHLDFQTDGNFVLYRTSDAKAMWSSGTYGNPGAVLTTKLDGDIVIYKDQTKQSTLWSTKTNVQNATRTIIVPDDNGYVGVFRFNNNNWIRLWDSSTGDGYFNLASGLYSQSLQSPPMAFSKRCTENGSFPSKDKSAILKAQANYCTIGSKMIDDPLCRVFYDAVNLDGDNNNFIKTSMDTYVKDILCADGYDTRFQSSDNNAQTKINKFCKCVNPVGDSRTIYKSSGLSPICYDADCIGNGYKTIDSIKSQSSCPTCMCVQNMTLTNLKTANNVTQTCSKGCTKLVPDNESNTTTGSPNTTTDTSNTNTTTGSPNTTTSTSNTNTTTGSPNTNTTTGSSNTNTAGSSNTTTGSSNTTTGSSNTATSTTPKTTKTTMPTSGDEGFNYALWIPVIIMIFLLFVGLVGVGVFVMKRKRNSSMILPMEYPYAPQMQYYNNDAI